MPDAENGGPDNGLKTRFLASKGWFDFTIASLEVATAVMCVVVGVVAKSFALFLFCAACIAVGFLVGFLFGFPRVVQSGLAPEDAVPRGATPTTTPSIGLGINSNLGKVSDFVTATIVGLSIANLNQLPYVLKRIVNFVAPGIGITRSLAECKVIVLTSLLYFTVGGFLFGYVITRTYLSRDFSFFDKQNIK
ncbi:MAG: hypothetical protein JWL77_3116 [Chthonomonadaceae bacterium]|nr:hypothetical protein [Chthonomonadaceae bacterium]